jgi:hypothetical protein
MSTPLITTPTAETTIGKFQTALAGSRGLPNGQDIFQILDLSGQVVVHMNSDGVLDPPICPQIGYFTITSAQLLALHTTQVILVPAQGPNLVVLPQQFTAIYEAGSTPYTVTGTDRFMYVGYPTQTFDANHAPIAIPDATFVDQASSQLYISSAFQSNPIPLSEATNQPLVLTINDTLTLGNGIVKLVISYTVASTI